VATVVSRVDSGTKSIWTPYDTLALRCGQEKSCRVLFSLSEVLCVGAWWILPSLEAAWRTPHCRNWSGSL
jgi:hypothetical protein